MYIVNIDKASRRILDYKSALAGLCSRLSSGTTKVLTILSHTLAFLLACLAVLSGSLVSYPVTMGGSCSTAHLMPQHHNQALIHPQALFRVLTCSHAPRSVTKTLSRTLSHSYTPHTGSAVFKRDYGRDSERVCGSA